MNIEGYTIQKTIGAGGMATAYLALQESLHRRVVVKVLHSPERSRREDMARFVREGRIVASLNHANIITIYDIGLSDDLMYMAMEYVDGGDLRTRLRTPFLPSEALQILNAVANGLNAAHKKGIIHRDVKPGNILFRRDGTPLLTDFGIAKEIAIDLDLTETGVFVGSPNYMAPEQATAGPVDGRADIYSLGIILYEMLTGMKPYQADSVVDVILMHKHAPVPKLAAGLEQYQPLLELMLAKNREDRFRDTDSLLHYLRQFKRPETPLHADADNAPLDSDLHQASLNPPLGDLLQHFTLPKPAVRMRFLLISGLLLSMAITYQTLRKINVDPRPTDRAPIQTDIDVNTSAREVPLPAHFVPTPPRDSATQEVIKALTWLGQHSLDDYRLTSPPQDNAYYYFTRLREIAPEDSTATLGFLKIAERFALLAEKELAADHITQARQYITIGLRIDPANRTLASLHSLTEQPPKDWKQRLREIFGAG